MLDSALDAIVGMDASGVVTEFNPAAERMFGYARADAVGQPMAELIVPPALRKQQTEGLARYLAGGESTILGRRIEITAMRSGYAVLDAAHGVAALAIWKANRDRIDLVFTDMVMPEGLSGRQLADQVLAERPDIRVIITSGYSVEVFGKELVPTDNVTFLQKPYQPQPLLACVRAMLDKRIA